MILLKKLEKRLKEGIKMNLQFYVEKLKNSEVFKNFLNEHPDAFLCSGFFVIDKTGKEANKQHFDYYLPQENKIESMQLENMQVVPIENFGEIPKELSFEYDFDFNKVEKMIEERMVEAGIKNKIQKMLFSLQKINGRNFLVGTIFISMLGMIQINIDLKNMEITEFEKKSLLDMVKVSKKKSSYKP